MATNMSAAAKLAFIAGAVGVTGTLPVLEEKPFLPFGFWGGGKRTRTPGEPSAPGSNVLRGYYGRYSHVLTAYVTDQNLRKLGEANSHMGLFTRPQRNAAKRARKADAAAIKALNKRTTMDQQSNARMRDRHVPMYPTRQARFTIRRYFP